MMLSPKKHADCEKVKNKNMLSTILAICYCVLIEITLKLEAVETPSLFFLAVLLYSKLEFCSGC